jgi:hypothetical protein
MRQALRSPYATPSAAGAYVRGDLAVAVFLATRLRAPVTPAVVARARPSLTLMNGAASTPTIAAVA